jgi:2-polyprenyl-3-methyl-5-hydroxy-6-metoxy-1,4-benzoquinol methylase
VKPPAEVAQDFDRIATALRKAKHPEQLSPAEHSVLQYIPENSRTALDVGCGDGRMARSLARRGISVLGIDVSPGMLELARARTDSKLPIEYQLADVATDGLRGKSFDVVLSVAMVHHLPLNEIVPRLAALVAPGGVLLIQDVTSRRGPRYLPSNVIAMITSRLRKFFGGWAGTREVGALYDKHSVGETYLSASEVERAYRPLLPDAIVKNHIEWRYTVIWRART